MPYKSAAYIDGGSDLLRTLAATTNRLRVHLLSSFSSSDSWATLLANSVVNAALVPGDITTAPGASGSRVTTFAAKTANATAADADLTGCVAAVLDHTSQVAHYVPATTVSPAAVTVGQSVAIAAFTETGTQPV